MLYTFYTLSSLDLLVALRHRHSINSVSDCAELEKWSPQLHQPPFCSAMYLKSWPQLKLGYIKWSIKWSTMINEFNAMHCRSVNLKTIYLTLSSDHSFCLGQDWACHRLLHRYVCCSQSPAECHWLHFLQGFRWSLAIPGLRTKIQIVVVVVRIATNPHDLNHQTHHNMSILQQTLCHVPTHYGLIWHEKSKPMVTSGFNFQHVLPQASHTSIRTRPDGFQNFKRSNLKKCLHQYSGNIASCRVHVVISWPWSTRYLNVSQAFGPWTLTKSDKPPPCHELLTFQFAHVAPAGHCLTSCLFFPTLPCKFLVTWIYRQWPFK